MSWVADAKAISHNSASDICSQFGPCSVSATQAKATPMMNCSATTQRRLLESKSTSGLHSGLMTQGR